MYSIFLSLEEELRRIEKYLDTIENRLKEYPKGNLKIVNLKGKFQYRLYLGKDSNGKNIERYLRLDDEKLNIYFQKKYDYQAKFILEKRKTLILNILKEKDFMLEEELGKIYYSHRNFFNPLSLIWKEKVKKWINEPYTPKMNFNDLPEIYTRNGERVRSKSEKILADIFYSLDIKYKYEKKLKLDNIELYPDFTFLSPYTGKEIYWEHFGIMDNPTYVNSAIKKILTYQKNNININENLIVTFETEQIKLNDQQVLYYINKFLKI